MMAPPCGPHGGAIINGNGQHCTAPPRIRFQHPNGFTVSYLTPLTLPSLLHTHATSHLHAVTSAGVGMGAIIGGIVGGVAIIGGLAGAALFYRRHAAGA